MTSQEVPSQRARRRRPPATTPEARENQLVKLATDLAEKQLAEGTASSQVIIHYLRLATAKEKSQLKKLEMESELLSAKTSQIISAEEANDRLNKAIAAFTEYSPTEDDEHYD